MCFVGKDTIDMICFLRASGHGVPDVNNLVTGHVNLDHLVKVEPGRSLQCRFLFVIKGSSNL